GITCVTPLVDGANTFDRRLHETPASPMRPEARRRSADGSGTPTDWRTGCIVPVNSPLPANVSPVMNAVTLFGSRFAEVSIPRTLNSDTPPGGKKNCVSAWIVVRSEEHTSELQ